MPELQITEQNAATLTPSCLIDGLRNPRSMLFVSADELLVIEAGSGDFGKPDGRLLRLRVSLDPVSHGALTAQVKSVVLTGQASMNMLPRMHRDEIVGLCHVAADDSGELYVSITNYASGSSLRRVAVDGEAIPIQGHINSFCFDATRECWFGIKSDSNLVFALDARGNEKLLTHLAPLPDGQDAVPVCILPEPASDSLLVSCFSGEVNLGAGASGVDFKTGAGKIVRVDPRDGRAEDLINGLTAPTCMTLDVAGRLYVLELCDAFVDPFPSFEAVEDCHHGGFRRFSGRLLRFEADSTQATVIATGLDTPSNLALHEGRLFISEGMGIPGRPIPGPDGRPQPLSGSIRYLPITA